jgi:hypothetical protein
MFKPRPDKLLLKSVLTGAGLGDLWDDWEKVLRPTIYLEKETEYTPETADDIPIGASKLLGFPDLPPDMPIPFDGDGNQCGFVGQINLADIAELDTENLLPKSGVLSFFYSGWGVMNADPVFYFPEGTPLQRQPGRYEDDYLPPYSLCFVGGWTCPFTLGLYNISDLVRTPLAFLPDQETYEKYNDFAAQETLGDKRPIEVRLNSPGLPRLLGHADERNFMEPICELVRRGIISGLYDTPPEWYKANQTLLESVEKQSFQNWICLFEDSEFSAVFLLDYMIRRDDLANLDFSKAICNASRCG